MKKDKIMEIAIQNLIDVELVLKDRYGEQFKTNLYKEPENDRLSLYTSAFILTFDVTDGFYYVTFVVGHLGSDIANYMIDIISILDVCELIVIDDFYVNKDNKFLYGTEAVEARQREILNSDGHDKCVVCGYVYPLEMLDNLICLSCKESMPTYAWN